MPKCMSCMNDFEQPDCCPYCGALVDYKVSDIDQLPPGTILNKRYAVGQVITKDKLGFTYIAWDGLQERRVAIKEWFPLGIAVREKGLKVTKKEREGSRDLADLFLESTKKVQQMQEIPSVIKIDSLFQENSTIYYVMEYLEGTTIAALLRRENPVVLYKAKKILNEILNGIRQIHKNGTIHGNLDPENIFIVKGGGVKFLNFSWITIENQEINNYLFQNEYASPEYFKKCMSVSEKIDIYSVYAVFYRMSVGIQPVSAGLRLEGQPLVKPMVAGIELEPNIESEMLRNLAIAGVKEKKKTDGILPFQIITIILIMIAIVFGVLLLLM